MKGTNAKKTVRMRKGLSPLDQSIRKQVAKNLNQSIEWWRKSSAADSSAIYVALCETKSVMTVGMAQLAGGLGATACGGFRLATTTPRAVGLVRRWAFINGAGHDEM